MLRRNWMLALAVLLIAMMVIAACGGSEPTEEPAPEPAAPAEATEAPAEEPTEVVAEEPTEEPVEEPTEEPVEEPTEEPVEEPTEAPAEEAAPSGPTLVVWADNTRAPAMLEIAPAFQEEYGVTLEVQELDFGQIRDQVSLAAPAGTGPDLFIGASDWVGELYVNGLLAPIDLGPKAEEFFPAALDLFTYNGELIGVPYGVENLAFFYNPEMVSEVPATWEDVKTQAIQLQEDGTVQYGFCRMAGDPFHFYPIQTGYGGYVFGTNEDGSWNPDDVGVGNEGSIAAATWLDEMVKAGVIDGNMDWDTLHVVFETGDCAMTITGPWALTRFRDAGANYAIADFPEGPAGTSTPFLGGQGFYLSAFSENQLLAQAFLTEFLATEPVMRAFFEADPRPSAYLPVRDNPNDPDMESFASAGANAVPMPNIPQMGAVWGPWGDAITLIGNQAATPEEAMTNAQSQIEAALAE